MNDQQAKQLKELHEALPEFEDEIARLADLIDGNPHRGIVGMRNRLEAVEERTGELQEERDRLVTYVKGGVAGLALNVLGIVILIVTVARLIITLGGAP